MVTSLSINYIHTNNKNFTTWLTLDPSWCVTGISSMAYKQSKLYSKESPWFTSLVWKIPLLVAKFLSYQVTWLYGVHPTSYPILAVCSQLVEVDQWTECTQTQPTWYCHVYSIRRPLQFLFLLKTHSRKAGGN